MENIKPGDMVKLSDRMQKDRSGFTDFKTGFTISPGQEKPLPKGRLSDTLQARIRSGVLVKVGGKKPTEAEKPEPEKPKEPEKAEAEKPESKEDKKDKKKK